MRSRHRRTPPRALQRSTGAYRRDKRAWLADKYIIKSPDMTALKWEMRVPLLPFVYSGRNRWRPRRQLQTLKDPPDRLVNGAPEILLLTQDIHEEFIQMPNVAQATLSAPECPCIFGTELQTPLLDSFEADSDPAL
jgi:hypothetical protein